FLEPDVGMPEYLAQHYFKQVVAGMVWAKTPYRGEPVDVWSCGVILTAMLTGDGTEIDHHLLKRMAVKYDEPCWSLTQPNQSTTSTVISPSSTDDSMVNCVSQTIKFDDFILITEPRSLTEMGDQDPSEHL
ncbi:unnamed protein product, partial [Rotaria socialis]